MTIKKYWNKIKFKIFLYFYIIYNYLKTAYKKICNANNI